MNLEFSDVAFDLLVAEREKKGLRLTKPCIFLTISPNPKTKIEVYKGRRLQKMTYHELYQHVQYDYCVKDVQETILPFLSKGAQLIGMAELNGNNDVHFHMLICDPKIRTTQQLGIFSRDVSNCQISIKNRKHHSYTDYMHNMFYCDDIDDRRDYMSQPDEQYGKTYYFDCNPKPQKTVKQLLRLMEDSDWL